MKVEEEKKSRVRTWKEFDVCIGKVWRIFGKFKIILYETLVFLNDKGSWGLIGVPIKIKYDPYLAKTPE